MLLHHVRPIRILLTCLSSDLLPLMLTCVSLPYLKLLYHLECPSLSTILPTCLYSDLLTLILTCVSLLLLLLLPRSPCHFHQPVRSLYLHRHLYQHPILSPLKPIHSLLGSCPPSFQLLRQMTPPDQTGLIPASSTHQPTLPITQQRTLVPKYHPKVLSRPQQRTLVPK